MAYMIGSTTIRAIEDARTRGWTQIAFGRFVTPQNVDVRVISRAADLIPFADKTPMLRSSCYDDPPAENEPAMEAWFKQQEMFDALVESGKGEWVDSLDG